MNRGEVWLAKVGAKRRPVLILTRNEVIGVRALVTVAEITTTARGLAVEVPLDAAAVGLKQECVVNCDGLHTIDQATIADFVGNVDDATMAQVCSAVSFALGC